MRFFLVLFLSITSLTVVAQDSTSSAPDTSHSGHDHHFDFDEAHYKELSPEGELVPLVPDSSEVVFDSLSYVKNLLVREILRDSVYWMGIDTLFRSFDTLNTNPYGYDGVKYKDTTVIQLYSTDSLNPRGWSMPLDRLHYITSPFGMRRYRWHYGADLRLVVGDSVRAVFDGVVRMAKYNKGGYGNYVLIRHHNGLETLYGHLKKSVVKVGQSVKAGEFIGFGGNTGRSTGPHLHFEVRYHGNAIDPTYVFNLDSTATIVGQELTVTPKHFDYIREMRKVVYHKIRSGDTLSGLAVKYHTTIGTLCRLNGINRSTILRIGRRLRVR